MGKEVALRQIGGVVAAQKYAEALAGLAGLVGADMDGKPILKLDRQEGFWRFGEGDTELTEKDVLAVNPFSFKKGFIAFADDGPASTIDGEVAEYLVPVTAPMPYKDELPEVEVIKGKRGKPDKVPSWDLQLTVDLMVVEGPNKGAEMVYKPTSKGGLRMVRKLSEEVARRLAEGDEVCVPVIEVFSETYTHKTYGRVFTPAFEIIDWSTMDDEEFGASTARAEPEEDAPKAKPAKHPKAGEKTAKGHDVDPRGTRKARAPEPEAEESEDEEEPAPRTRGRRAEPDDAAPARSGRARREPEPDPAEEEEPAPRARSRRDRDADDVPAATSKAGTRRRAPEPEEEGEEEEAAPRTRRSRGETEEEAPRRARSRTSAEPEPAGVRGRRATVGHRAA